MRNRSCSGNILATTICLCTIVACMVVAAAAVAVLLQSSRFEQTRADSIALEMAKLINSGDRVGELNNMTEYARELVYTSRINYNTIRERHPQIEGLAQIMLDDARQGAQLVAQERAVLRAAIIDDLKNAVNRNETALSKTPGVNMASLNMKQPAIQQIYLGVVTGVGSNAEAPTALAELAEMDQARSYLFSGTRFYRANIDAKLPAPDSDLTFKFSALAPPVEKTWAPARLMCQESFTRAEALAGGGAGSGAGQLAAPADNALPCALQLEISMPVKWGNEQHDVRAVANAATTGGAPPL